MEKLESEGEGGLGITSRNSEKETCFFGLGDFMVFLELVSKESVESKVAVKSETELIPGSTAFTAGSPQNPLMQTECHPQCPSQGQTP